MNDSSNVAKSNVKAHIAYDDLREWLARAELLDMEKTPGAGTPAKEPRLGRTGQHEHRCAYNENLFHGAPFTFEPTPVEFGVGLL